MDLNNRKMTNHPPSPISFNHNEGVPNREKASSVQYDQGVKHRKVDSVLRSVEEERYECTGGHFLKKIM